MSYSFDGVNDELSGAFSGAYGQPCTVACFVKVTVHPLAGDTIVQLGDSPSSNNTSVQIRTGLTDDQWGARSINSTGTANTALRVTGSPTDGIWAGLVGLFTSDTSRRVYIGSITETALTTTSIVVGATLDSINVAAELPGAGYFTGLLAEIAIWDIALSTAQVTDYLAGVRADTIAASNLIGYWPLSASNATQSNLGVDAAGDLTVSGAVFDSDHPTISGSDTTITPNTAGMGV